MLLQYKLTEQVERDIGVDISKKSKVVKVIVAIFDNFIVHCKVIPESENTEILTMKMKK